MVNALRVIGRTVVGWLQEVLEIVGLACLAVGVAVLASPDWVWIVVGAGLLLKSFEVDLLQRNDRRGAP